MNAAEAPAGALARFAGRSVTVRVPATTANLGPGFDTLGLALSLYDELTVTVREAPGVTVEVIGVGAGEVPTDESNLVVTAIARTFAHYGQPMPGIDLVARNNIPHGRGLGSSGAFTVGLLRALYAHNHEHVPAGALAEEACHIEIDRLPRAGALRAGGYRRVGPDG